MDNLLRRLPRAIPSAIQIIQLSNVSDKQEVQVGKQIHKQLLSSGQVKLLADGNLNQYVSSIGHRLASQSKRTNIPYSFFVVADKSVNAFATMGGHVYINAGLIAKAENEAELAGVVAHEIGHISGRHVIKQMRENAVRQGVATTAGVDRDRIVQIGIDLALRRPYSRQHEHDADKRGLRMMSRANYAPTGMVTFMRKLEGTSPVPEFLSTHPSPRNRVVNLQQEIREEGYTGSHGLDSAAYRQRIGLN